MQDKGEEQMPKTENTILVGSDGGSKQEMTVAQADAQVEKELKKAQADAPEGATVRVVQEGQTTSVVTEVPDDKVPPKKPTREIGRRFDMQGEVSEFSQTDD